MTRAFLLAVLIGCGGGISAAELEEARTAEHALGADSVMAVARMELDGHDYYDVVPTMSDEDTLVTTERAFLDGTPAAMIAQEESGRRRIPTQYVRLRATVIATPSGQQRVEVQAKAREIVGDRRSWDWGDPTMPYWARDEADAMQVRIHRSLESATRR